MATISVPHAWDVTLAEARAIQERLRARVITEDRLGPVRRVAGVDVGFEAGGRVTRAAVVMLDFPALGVCEQVVARLPTAFPYVPGLLSFREIPAVLKAVEQLRAVPDVFICDGQGIAHPRRFGVACHLGVLTGLPAIGVAKKRLVGVHAEVPEGRGESVALVHEGEQIGAVLRSRAGVKPIYISVGHRIALSTAVDLVMRCVSRYRLPEPTRLADRLASRRDRQSTE